MAAVNGGRLGGGGGLDRARGASTIPAERSGLGKGGYSTLLSAHALVSGSIDSYLEGSCQWSRSRAPDPNGWASRAGRAYGARAGGAWWAREGRRAKAAGVRLLEGRKRAGPILHVCRATARARGWVGRSPSDSISLSLPVDSARMK